MRIDFGYRNLRINEGARGNDTEQTSAWVADVILDAPMTSEARDQRELRFDTRGTNPSSARSVADIARLINVGNASLIALDGLPGSGKSTLAIGLSAWSKIRVVHLDDFLGRDRSGFTNHLVYERLQRALLRRPVIVEGVCMLDVLDRLSLRPDRFVYLEAAFAARRLDRGHPLVREVRAYTDRSNPLERAGLVLARSERGSKSDDTPASRPSGFDACLMRNRSLISRALATAGMITLALGAACVVVGSFTASEAADRLDEGEIALVGAGLMTMLVSGIWIILARLALPPASVRRPPRSEK